jgi:hypothetical protein
LSRAPLPKDAVLIDLRPDALVFETRECLLPGTLVSLTLVLEGRPLTLHIETSSCSVMDKDRLGYIYRSRLAFDHLPEADRRVIALFIDKGRGEPGLQPAPVGTRF